MPLGHGCQLCHQCPTAKLLVPRLSLHLAVVGAVELTNLEGLKTRNYRFHFQRILAHPSPSSPATTSGYMGSFLLLLGARDELNANFLHWSAKALALQLWTCLWSVSWAFVLFDSCPEYEEGGSMDNYLPSSSPALSWRKRMGRIDPFHVFPCASPDSGDHDVLVARPERTLYWSLDRDSEMQKKRKTQWEKTM